MNIIEYIGEENEREILFIRGHLYLENLMVEIIKKVYRDSNAALEVGKMFYNKVKQYIENIFTQDEISEILC